ncbi:histidine phosphatase family protein [Corynebacterium halotolerans]|uniref:Phosphoglycerate mutase n=1 Tax=Corynebacterium halotolerans YIM 70093 = DSM 44683 TaxID=1121362 RepID=M1MZN8_9CORY|nr:histidine phosphatase family protein [Corynebacterium halotolerans]AGF73179.1 phosphoglycerate mutase [Corynebacterium halotolerans YIM 70093 = DSM 44683]
MSRRLILIRHGQTHYNATRRMQGQLDTQLSEVGRDQAWTAGEKLRNADIQRIIASDLSRAQDTAEIIAGILGVEVGTDPRLRETHLGQWQSKTHMDVDAESPGARAVWRHDASWAPPGGESRLDVAKRARPVVDELMADYDGWEGGSVLFVAHGGTISALTSNLLGFEAGMYPILSGLRNTCWSQLTARPRFFPGSAEAGDEVRPSVEFTPGTVGDPQWYLDGWNMG